LHCLKEGKDRLSKELEDIYGKSYSRHLWTIKVIDKEYYDLLLKVICQDIRDSLAGFT
jgi:hypothetical protein